MGNGNIGSQPISIVQITGTEQKPKLTIDIDGKDIVRDLTYKEEFDPLDVIETQFSLKKPADTDPDFLKLQIENLNGTIDRLIVEVATAGKAATLRLGILTEVDPLRYVDWHLVGVSTFRLDPEFAKYITGLWLRTESIDPVLLRLRIYTA